MHPILPCVPGAPDDVEIITPPVNAPPHLKAPDLLEAALSSALAEYRFRAEEILDEHREKLAEMDAAHQLETANLRAENSMLRTKLRINNGHGPNLFQTVVLEQAKENSVESKKRELQKAQQSENEPISMKRGASVNRPSVDSGWKKGGVQQNANSQAFSAKVNGNGAQAGRWEQFVAWVPNGAALQNPAPWKPLEDGMCAITSMLDEKEETDSSDRRYELLEVWRVSKEDEARAARKKIRKGGGVHKDDVSDFEVSERGDKHSAEEHLFGGDRRDRCTVHPHSTTRICWDMMSLVMTVYDMVMIPMGFFELPDNFFLISMAWATRLFWTLDMPMSCITGVVLADGSVKMEVRFIAKRYAKTWLILDVLIVGSDWGEYAYSSSNVGSGAGAMKITRVLRASRAVRLLRLAKMKEVIGAITERIQSDQLAFMLHTLKCLVFIVGCAHVIACGWWGIGARAKSGTWNSGDYASSTVENQYLISLHWALAQFTGGMDEVFPLSAVERFYAVLIWTFAFVCASVVVSMMTSNLTQMHIVGGNTARQMATLRKYLKQNAISSNLALRMQRSAQHALSGDLTPDLVELLPIVAEPLRVEMHFEMFVDILRRHPFFCDFIIESPHVMRRVCHYATSPVLMTAGDVVFSEGEAAGKMYFVVRGTLDYISEEGETTTVSEGMWLAEGVLWTTWVYKGTLTATSDVKLAMLDARTFHDLVKRFKDAVGSSFNPRQYAMNFVSFLNEFEDATDLSIMKYP